MLTADKITWRQQKRICWFAGAVPGIAFVCMVLATNSDAQPVQEGRIRPPAVIECPRNQLTAFQGVARQYARKPGQTRLQVATNEETIETFVFRHPESGSPEKYFLLRGQLFTAADWSLIESAPGHLLPGVRVTVWVCRAPEGIEAIADWTPPDRSGGVQP